MSKELTPEEVDAKLRKWLSQEDKRWRVVKVRVKRQKFSRKAMLATVGLTPEDVKKPLKITPKSAKAARELLGLDWLGVEKISGVFSGAVIGLENGRWCVPQALAIQHAFEGEGIVFGADGSITCLE